MYFFTVIQSTPMKWILYQRGTKLRPPCLELSNRCKHVHAVLHVDLLYTVKHSTGSPAQQSPTPAI